MLAGTAVLAVVTLLISCTVTASNIVHTLQLGGPALGTAGLRFELAPTKPVWSSRYRHYSVGRDGKVRRWTSLSSVIFPRGLLRKIYFKKNCGCTGD
jgi:hypothetical protein